MQKCDQSENHNHSLKVTCSGEMFQIANGEAQSTKKKDIENIYESF